MDRPEREPELWQRAAEAQQPDEKRKRGIREALERYYRAVGLLRTGRRYGATGEDVSSVDPIERVRRIE